jgi:branched-chain amino acid transport system permease protein
MTSTSDVIVPVRSPGRVRHAGIALTLAAGLAIGLFGGETLLVQATDILIFALFALSLNLVVGQSGMASMCHAAFFATGGYVFGVLQVKYGWTGAGSTAAAAVLAVAASMFLALVIGLLITRVSHAYFIMLTLALGQLVYIVIWKWHSITGGDDGLIGIVGTAALQETRTFFMVAFAALASCVALLSAITRSAFGQTLTAIRDNPLRAAFIGVPVRSFRLAAFVLAASFAALAGVGQAIFHRGIFPSSASFITSADGLVAVVLGGTQWFLGPLVGAIVFKILSYGLPHLTSYWLSCLGVVIIIVALSFPGGLLSLAARFDARWRR